MRAVTLAGVAGAAFATPMYADISIPLYDDTPTPRNDVPAQADSCTIDDSHWTCVYRYDGESSSLILPSEAQNIKLEIYSASGGATRRQSSTHWSEHLEPESRGLGVHATGDVVIPGADMNSGIEIRVLPGLNGPDAPLYHETAEEIRESHVFFAGHPGAGGMGGSAALSSNRDYAAHGAAGGSATAIQFLNKNDELLETIVLAGGGGAGALSNNCNTIDGYGYNAPFLNSLTPISPGLPKMDLRGLQRLDVKRPVDGYGATSASGIGGEADEDDESVKTFVGGDGIPAFHKTVNRGGYGGNMTESWDGEKEAVFVGGGAGGGRRGGGGGAAILVNKKKPKKSSHAGGAGASGSAYHKCKAGAQKFFRVAKQVNEYTDDPRVIVRFDVAKKRGWWASISKWVKSN